MASTGFTVSGTQASVQIDASDIAWLNMGNVTASDDARANADGLNSTSNPRSEQLQLTNFGFSIPAGATIDGIEVRIEGGANNGGANTLVDTTVSLIKGGTVQGANKAFSDWTEVEKTVDYGGIADLWALTLTPATR